MSDSVVCEEGHVFSEREGKCVFVRDDFHSCEEEKRKGACKYDEMVRAHCQYTCSNVSLIRDSFIVFALMVCVLLLLVVFAGSPKMSNAESTNSKNSVVNEKTPVTVESQ